MSQFIHEDQVKSNMGYVLLFKKMWPYCRRHWMLLATGIISVFGVAIAGRFLNILIGQAIDEGFLKNNPSKVLQIALLFLAIEVVLTLFMFSYQLIFQRFGNRILFYIREDMIAHLQSLPVQYFNKTPVGRIVTRVTNDIAQLAELFTDGVVNVFTEFIILLSIVIAMFLISPKLTLYVLLAAPIFVYLSIIISNRIREILRESKKKLSELNSYVAENLQGIKIVQLYNRVPKNRKRFAHYSNEYAGLTVKSIRAYALMMPVMNLFTATTVTLALYFGGATSLEGGIPIGLLVTFILHTQDFILPLREILEKYQQFQNSLTSAERVFQLFDEKSEPEAIAAKLELQQADIKFVNMSFQYEPQLPMVLKNINLHIHPGESVAIIGRTGSGKSTLISLLQAFYPAPEKQVYISDTPIEDIPKKLLRRFLGVVQQDHFIFRGSLRENITLNDSNISEESIVNACKEIGYWDLLQRTGRSLDAFIEERGANLSVGEKQLIAFARILVFAPQILILDEATAHVDSQTEQLIQRATAQICKGRTSIIIAHRLSTIQNCDRIIVLDHGEILEMGSHKQLLERKGLYYEYHSRGFIEDDAPSS